jgi:ribosomal protein L16 Arg81 hydroxylase
VRQIIQNKTFLANRLLNKHYYFGNSSLPAVSWDSVIGCLNYNVKEKLHIKSFPNLGIVLHDCSVIPYVASLLKQFSELDNTVGATVHAYISLLENSDGSGRHKDTSDVLYWQAIGTTKWVVEDKGVTHSYMLQHNDVIYVPRDMYHTVTPITPRVGISFGLDY